MIQGQRSLFGGDALAFDATFRALRRTSLSDGAWIDHCPGWVAGHERLMDRLVESTRWQKLRQPMYDRVVDVPRLVASLPEDGPGDPFLETMSDALAARYGTKLPHVGLALYRDGNDSVAWHGDRVGRDLPEALVATVSLGEPRRFGLRPAAGGASRWLMLGWGDLLVMGGSCQRTWRHAIPKVAHAHPRVVIAFRPHAV